MFDQYAKDNNEKKNSSANVVKNHTHLCQSIQIFLTSVQGKTSTSF